MKRTLITAGLVIGLIGSVSAQSNVEKAKRFRAQKKVASMETQTKAHLMQFATQTMPVNVLESNANAQIKELGPFGWNSNAVQVKELGGFIWNSNAEQVKELGGYLWNNDAAQVKELGNFQWNSNAAQLQDLGKRILFPTRGAEQLDELGPRWKWWNAEQLEELGPGRTF